MKEKMITLLNKLSPNDFNKVKQIYSMTRGIKGNTVEEFANNVPDDTIQGIINLCNKQLGI